MPTPYRVDFQKGETITHTDIDNNFALIKQGVMFDIGALVTEAIKNGTIKLEDLSQEVTNLLAGRLLEIEYFDLTGVETFVTLTKTPFVGSERIFLNGLIQRLGEFYTIATSVITFVNPGIDTGSGDRLTVSYESL